MAPEFSISSDSVDVEQIMKRIRARIREKRGVDYTEEEIRELANVKLETFLDPSRVRSELLTYYRQMRSSPPVIATLLPPAADNYAFEGDTPYVSSRGPVGRSIQLIRRLLNPLLKLFINPNPFIHVLNMQSRINAQTDVRVSRLFELWQGSEQRDYEILHNLVVEMTRLGIEVKNLKMRVESLSSRLEFDERRARALEAVVQYKPGAGPTADTARPSAPVPTPGQAPRDAEAPGGTIKGEAQRNRRRRRRRGPRPGGGRPQPGGGAADGGQAGDAGHEGGEADSADDRAGRHGGESSLPFDADRPAPPARADEPTDQ